MEEEEPAGQDGVEQCPGEIIKKNPWGSWSQGERERELKEENAGGAMRLKPWLVQQGPMSWAQRHWSEGQASGDKGAIDYNFLSCSKNFF